MKHKYTFTLDVEISDKLDLVRGLVSRSAYINDMISKIVYVDETKNKKESSKSKVAEMVDQNQVIKIEIIRLVQSLKNHHRSISEIKMFMKASLSTVNNIKPGKTFSLEEFSDMLRVEAEKQGVKCID